MKPIGERNLLSFVSGKFKPQSVTVSDVRKDEGFFVKDYPDLAQRVAALSFYNPEFLLFFRGQGRDHKNKAGKSSIKPGVFRSENGTVLPPKMPVIRSRYRALLRAEQQLAAVYEREKFIGRGRIQRYRILRWAILQHYEVCATPLLDVTHSLRIAASFATHSQSEEGVVQVIALPNLAGSVTASSEEGIQIIRLNSICPPQALRPHFQEGYLIGEYPEMVSADQKQFYSAFEVDFGLRLLGKFRFDPKTFWRRSPEFPLVDKDALYPNGADPFYRAMREIRP